MARDVTVLLPAWLRELTPYAPGKPIDELEREYGIVGSIKLASNENPLGPSPRAVAAMRAALSDVHRYPDGGVFHLTHRLARKFGLGPEHFIVGNGSNEIIELIVRAFVQPGDEVLMADQAFVIYAMVAQAVAGSPRPVPLRDYTHDLDAIASAITRRTRVIFLANPNNPTGTIYRREAWEEFLKRVPARVIVVIDEAYAEFVEDPAYPDSLAAHGSERLLITLRTFSKLYGLAGLRVGYGISRPDIIAALHRVRQPFNVNALAQVAAVAALDDEEHAVRTREGNREGRAFLEEECRRLALPVVPSSANFVLIEVGAGQDVYEALLRRGVIVRPMGVYRFPRHIRVTVGTMAENRRFVAALEAVLAAREGAGPGPLFQRLAVLGVGVIGGSLARAVRDAGLVGRTVGCARTAESRRIALERRLVDEVSDDPAAAVAEADLVVLAVPVGAMRSVAETIVTRLRPGTVVMDVGSVKAVLVEQLEPLFRRAGCRFVGSHPIAGKEGGGPAEADPHLFHDRRCILTPTVRTDPGALSRLRALWQGIGMQVEDLDPVTHDRILARVSHVPHLVAYALAAAVGEAQVPGGPVADYAGSGFRDTTRIAASSAELWRDIALANRAEVLAGLEEFRGHLKTLGEIIERGDGAALERALDVARRHRRNLGPG